MIFRLCMVCRMPSFGAIMQTMQIMQNVQIYAGTINHANHAKRSNDAGYIKPCKSCRSCKTFKSMQAIETMQIMQIMQVMRSCKSAENCAFPFQKLRSKGRAGPYGRPVVGWKHEQRPLSSFDRLALRWARGGGRGFRLPLPTPSGLPTLPQRPGRSPGPKTQKVAPGVWLKKLFTARQRDCASLFPGAIRPALRLCMRALRARLQSPR